MLYQILLVDDEPLVHHHLKTITDWPSQGFELSGEAYSGPMALEVLETARPHIAILDVDMPGMNGVELQRTIRERYPAVKTIMLSSYDDYDYVRECLRNGAVDYVLKHRLNEQSLLAILKRAAQEVQEEARTTGSGMAGRHTEADHGAEDLREQTLRLLAGAPEAAGILFRSMRRSGLPDGVICYMAAAVQIVPFLLLTQTRSDMQMNTLVSQVVQITQQSLGELPQRMAVYVENGRLAVLLAFTERSEQTAASEAGRLMSNISHALALFLNLKCTSALGHVCGSLSVVEASYRAAERLLDNAAALEEPAGGPDSPRLLMTIANQKQLLLAIERLDKDGVERSIAEAFAPVQQYPLHSPSVQMIVSELLAIGEKTITRGNGEAGGLPSREELGSIGSVAGLEQWLKAYYASLLGSLRRHQAHGTYSRHVSHAVELILERYPSYITLELAADRIGLNPSYLSRIFKEETRTTFSEYVNRVRIDASCRLLEAGNSTVKQISSQVGFTTYNYFFKVFKELTGTTPHAFMSRPPGAE